MHIALGDLFRSAHDARWIHRFVGRDEYEFLHPVLICQIGRALRSEHIVLETLSNIGFHQADMFVGRGVKHVVWVVFLKQMTHARVIFDIDDVGVDTRFLGVFGHLAIDQEQTVLTIVEEDQVAWLELTKLAA